MSPGRARRHERRAMRRAVRRANRTPRLGLPWLRSALGAIEAICRGATPGAWIASETFTPKNPGWTARRLVDFASAEGGVGLEISDPADLLDPADLAEPTDRADPRLDGAAGASAGGRARREDWWFVATFYPRRVVRILALLRAQVDLLRHLCDGAREPTCAHPVDPRDEVRSFVGVWNRNPLVGSARCDRPVSHRCDRLGTDPWICDLHRHRQRCCAPLDVLRARDWLGASLEGLARVASAATPGSWRIRGGADGIVSAEGEDARGVGARVVIESVGLDSPVMAFQAQPDAPVLALRAQDGGPARAGDCAHVAAIHPARALALLAALEQVSAVADWVRAQPEFAMHGAGARIRAAVEGRLASTPRKAAALDPRFEARTWARAIARAASRGSDLPPDPRTNEGRHDLALRARQAWGPRAGREMSKLQILGHWMCARIGFGDEPANLLDAPAGLLRDAAQSVDARIRAAQEEGPSARQRKKLRWLSRWRDRIAAEIARQAGDASGEAAGAADLATPIHGAQPA